MIGTVGKVWLNISQYCHDSTVGTLNSTNYQSSLVSHNHAG